MYSDQFSGQNRNIKLSLLCPFIISSSEYTVKKIDYKFVTPNIFIPEDWNNVILAARKETPLKLFVWI